MATSDVIVKLRADLGSFKSNLDEAKKSLLSLNNSAMTASNGVGAQFKKIGTVVATAFAIDKVKDFTKELIETTAKVNALDSMFTQTFKGNQAEALEKITAQSKEQGIAVDRLKGTWASFYGTFKGNGADVNQSLELTRRYMKLAGDGSAYYDKSLEEVVERLKSITMGNFEAGDAIGLNLSATKLDTIAKQKYNKAWQKLNDTEKEFLLIDTAEQIYEASGAMGQGARESNNWENVTQNLKSAWERLLSVVGQPVLATATIIVQNLTTAVQTITSAIQPFAVAFQDAGNAGGGFFDEMSAGLKALGMDGLAGAFSTIGTVVGGITGTLSNFVQLLSKNSDNGKTGCFFM